MRTPARRALAVLAGLAVLQLIPVSRTNPPVEETVPASNAVASILRRSCFDCHSHETTFPWYTRVAPASWLIAYDVREGRRHLNFSTWNRLDAAARREAAEDIWDEVSAGRMPLGIYLPLHPDARLTDHDRALLEAWTITLGRTD